MYKKLPFWPEEQATFSPLQVESFFIWCSKNKVSDITIQTDQPIVVEKDGNFSEVTRRRLSPNEVEDVLVKLYDGEVAKGLIQKGTDIDCSYEARPSRSERYRFRVNVTPVYGGMQITARAIEDVPPPIASMGVSDEILQNIAPKNGLILVTGATGSGKTTLLASIIRYLLEQPEGQRKIITYEAPIEFIYTGIQRGPSPVPAQTEIGEGRMLPNWAYAIRNALRRAPDVILLGESRDAETIGGTIEACQTGHLVFSTIHTSGFVETIPRMVSQFPTSEKIARIRDIASSLQMVISQMLVPKVGGGRIALREYVIFNDEIVDMLINGSAGGIDDIQLSCRDVLDKFGHSFFQDAQEKFADGLISEKEFREINRKVDAEKMDQALQLSRRQNASQAALATARHNGQPEAGNNIFGDLLRKNQD